MKTRRTRSLSPERAGIAEERIEILFKLAEKELKNPGRSRRYVELAKKIGTRCNVRLTPEQKRKFCKKCNQMLIPKKTCEITESKKNLVEMKCLSCGSIYKKSKKI